MAEDIVISDRDQVGVEELDQFFRGWYWSPPADAREALLRNSQIVVSARRDGRLIGIATALTDGAIFAYLSMLEVLPDAQGLGVGGLLVDAVVARVRHQYDIATITDAGVVPFYRNHDFADDVSGVHLRFQRPPERRTHTTGRNDP